MLQHRSNNRELAEKLKKFAYYEGLWRTSLNYQATQFFQNSTLHGVRYIAETERPFLEKFMWFCCVTIGAIATMIIIVSLWGKFQTNPTITGLDTDFHNWDVQFPALTLCESDPFNESYIDDYINKKWSGGSDETRKNYLRKLTKLGYENMKEFEKCTANDELYPKGDNLRDLIYTVVSRCEDIFFDCKWKDEDYDCCSGLFPIFTEHGFCYTFNSKHHERHWPGQDKEPPDFKQEYIQETDSKWSFSFSSNSPKMLIFIHNSDEVPSIDINPQHIWDQRVDKISFSMKQTYTTSDADQLTIRQRRCIFEDEFKLKIDKIYTYTSCTRQKRMEAAKRLCGCIPFFYPLLDGFTYCNLREIGCIIKHFNEITNVEGKGCELGCSNTVYEVEKLSEKTEMSSESGDTGLESEFVSWPMVRYKREVLFGWVDLLVAFGGIAGLFLGFSLLSGVEIIYYFTMRACCMIYRDRSEVERIKLEHSIKEKPDYDLSLVPYKKESEKNGGMNELLKKDVVLMHKMNRIDPIIPSKPRRITRTNEIFHPPFGIEFLN